MSSKEALDKLNYECIHSNGADDESSKEFNLIKKDLEVLEILKQSIFNHEIHKYALDLRRKGQKFMSIAGCVRGDNNIAKVKEWLENED